jgi:tRNA (guanine-N7-)-methyltransferase
MEDQLFITRKRKKWKFAHFNQWKNCFQASNVTPELWRTYFPQPQPLIVEIGAGTADLSVELARCHPERNVVAVDVKSDRLYTGAKLALAEKLANVAFVRAQLRQMDQLFAPGSINELWITFPDPFPRDKQAKHRLLHPTFLKIYRKLLTANGTLHFKTDNRALFLWSLEQLVTQGWHVQELSFDLHESELSDEYKITTRFERRFLAQATPINYVTARPPALASRGDQPW